MICDIWKKKKRFSVVGLVWQAMHACLDCSYTSSLSHWNTRAKNDTCTKDTLSLHNSGQRDEWMHTSMRIVCDTFVKLCFSHWSIPKIWSLWSYLPLQFQAFNRPQTKTWAYSHPSSISLLHTLTLSQTTASKMRESFSVTSSGVNRRYFCGFLVAKPECR